MSEFAPKDPDFDARVRNSFNRQQAMHTLGVRIVDLSPGRITLTMDYNHDYTQQHGFIHGGIISTLLDGVCGYAAFSLMPAEVAVLTVEFKCNFLNPAAGDVFRFEGNVIKPGRSLTVCEGRAFARKDSGEKLIATMTATLMSILGREGVSQ